MDLIDIIESRRFLGSEFLTWLCYACDQQGGRFDLPGIGTVELSFEDQLLLEAFLVQTERSRLSGGAPSSSPEARMALRAGKRVAKARLKLVRDGREWLFTVDGRQFDFSGVKIPAVLADNEEELVERLSLIDELSTLWLALYEQFLRLRLGEDSGDLEQSLSTWILEDPQP